MGQPLATSEFADTLSDSLRAVNDSIAKDSALQHVVDSIVWASGHQESNAPVVEVGPDLYWIPLCILAIVASALYMNFGSPGQWAKGRFPKSLKYKPRHVQLAYMHLAVQMLKHDREHIRETSNWILRYLNERFPAEEKKDREDLNLSMKHDVSTASVMHWLMKRMPAEHRIQVVSFLIEIAFFNEKLTKNELAYVYHVGAAIQIPRDEIDRMVRLRTQKARQDRSEHIVMGKTMREHCLNLLGLSKFATELELEEQFRDLIKMYHPALFAGMSHTDQLMAKERFEQFEKAYQYVKLNPEK